MTLRSYLVIMLMATIICWSVFGFVLMSVDPFTTNHIGFGLFYSSLFLALIGTASVLGFVVRFVALKKELAFRLVKDAFRQSFLFSFLIVAILFLLSRNLFSWLNVLALAAGLSVLEFFLLSYERR